MLCLRPDPAGQAPPVTTPTAYIHSFRGRTLTNLLETSRTCRFNRAVGGGMFYISFISLHTVMMCRDPVVVIKNTRSS